MSSIWDLLICGDIAVQQSLIDYIFNKFKSRKITMKNFIKHYLPLSNGVHVQIALYVQGLRYHTSRARRGGLPELVDPEPIIKNIASGYRQHKFEQYVKAENKKIRAEMERLAARSKHHRRLLKHQEFMETHGAPNTARIFTEKEVKEYNLEKKPVDHLELMPSGLLRHRCCFPKC